MNKYEKYKKVDLPWLEEVPEHWEVKRNKLLFQNKKNIVGDKFNKIDLLSLTTQGIKKRKLTDTKGKQPASYATYQEVSKGELVLCLFDLDCSAVFSDVSNYDGMVSPAYDVFKIKNGYNKYYKYIFDYLFQDRVYKIFSKSVRYTVTVDNFYSLDMILPPLAEQEQIAAYLDWKINEIDKLIAVEKEKISVLKEKELSETWNIVFHTLSTKKKYKRISGEYINQIPVEWKYTKLKNLFEIKKRIAGKEGYSVLSITQKGIKVKDISKNEGQMASDYSNYQIVEIGDFAMNHMDLLTGYIDISNFNGVTSPDYRVFTTKSREVYDRYFLILFQLFYKFRIFYKFGKGASSIGRWRLPAEEFLNFYVPLPSKEEQQRIVEVVQKAKKAN